MYACPKFQLIRRTSDFGTKFSPKNMNDKNFEKINIQIVISITIAICTPVPNFSYLIWRTSDFGTKFAQKNMNGKNFEKINIKLEKRI